MGKVLWYGEGGTLWGSRDVRKITRVPWCRVLPTTGEKERQQLQEREVAAFGDGSVVCGGGMDFWRGGGLGGGCRYGLVV